MYRDIILSTEAMQTMYKVYYLQRRTNTKQHRQYVTKQQILIGLDTAIGCIIWTAPDYSSQERPFIVEWQQTSHGLLQPAALCARPACHNLESSRL